MCKFIELPLVGGDMVCINADYIEEVRKIDEETCIVYMAFNLPDAFDQDNYKINMSYEKVASILMVIR